MQNGAHKFESLSPVLKSLKDEKKIYKVKKVQVTDGQVLALINNGKFSFWYNLEEGDIIE